MHPSFHPVPVSRRLVAQGGANVAAEVTIAVPVIHRETWGVISVTHHVASTAEVHSSVDRRSIQSAYEQADANARALAKQIQQAHPDVETPARYP